MTKHYLISRSWYYTPYEERDYFYPARERERIIKEKDDNYKLENEIQEKINKLENRLSKKIKKKIIRKSSKKYYESLMEINYLKNKESNYANYSLEMFKEALHINNSNYGFGGEIHTDMPDRLIYATKEDENDFFVVKNYRGEYHIPVDVAEFVYEIKINNINKGNYKSHCG